MMKTWILTALFLLTHAGIHAATVIYNYQGGGNPILQSWTGSNTASTNVQFSSAVVDGRNVWQITDPGLSTEETGLKANSQYYYVSMTPTAIATYLQSGWDLEFSMKVPSLTEYSGVDWTRDSSAMIGIYWRDPANTDTRYSFSIQTGRDSNGNTTVALGGLSGFFTLSPDFHAYKLSYRGGVAQFFIDGELKGTTNGSSASNTAVNNFLYWGDNNNTLTENSKGSRTTYFESMTFSQVPEPRKAMLCVIGAMALLLPRRRSASSKLSLLRKVLMRSGRV